MASGAESSGSRIDSDEKKENLIHVLRSVVLLKRLILMTSAW